MANDKKTTNKKNNLGTSNVCLLIEKSSISVEFYSV